MDYYEGLDPSAKELVRQYRQLLDSLPRTFSTFIITELQKWPDLFEPEKAYFRTLLQQLGSLVPSDRQQIFGSLAAFEMRSGCNQIQAPDPVELDQLLIRHIKRSGLWIPWRAEIDQIFAKIQPGLDAALYGADHSHRLVVILYDQGITIERNQLWHRFRDVGLRVPLSLGNALTTGPFLEELFSGRTAESAPDSAPTLFTALSGVQRAHPHDVWIIDAGSAAIDLCQKSVGSHDVKGCPTGLSYARLRDFRQKISDVIYNQTSTGQITGPTELADYLRTLDIAPVEGDTLNGDPLVSAFVRDILLGGAGTLIINNTFVEWSAIQAMKRAQPHVVVARFGVRYKMKPFSSMLLFCKPRPTDKIPWMLDPWGSFVDVEVLSYYIWLKSQQLTPYRGKTLYLLLADGVEEMMVVKPGQSTAFPKASQSSVRLSDVAATMAEWMGVTLPGSTGRPLMALLS
jgi:hypothetical protein